MNQARLRRLNAIPARPTPSIAQEAGAVSGGALITVESSGENRIAYMPGATLTVTGQPGNLQIRLMDPASRNERAGIGASTGDFGAPVFREIGGRRKVVGVVSWSTAPGNEAGCGGLTGVTPLSLYYPWIVETAKKLGSPLAP